MNGNQSLYLRADDPSVALRVEQVVETGLVLVRGAPVVVDGVEVVHAHLVGLENNTNRADRKSQVRQSCGFCSVFVHLTLTHFLFVTQESSVTLKLFIFPLSRRQ